MCLISSPSITGVLVRMEEAGMVQRERMDHDQRRLKVSLSARGRQLARRMAPGVEQRYETLESLVGVKPLMQVYDVLDMLLRKLEAHADADADAAGKPAPGAKRTASKVGA